MPYAWSDTQKTSSQAELRLWPHQSLPPKGLAAFVLVTFTFLMIPVLILLGSVLLWGILPFVLLVLAGLWHALQRNHIDHQILEVLTLDKDQARLTRQTAHGETQDWACNRYWTSVELHEKDGPVPNYVTLQGNGREVEIGAFLSEDERKALYFDLQKLFRK